MHAAQLSRGMPVKTGRGVY